MERALSDMERELPGFDDALTIVAVANTANFLRSKLSGHPLVQYLAESFGSEQLEEDLSNELCHFDGHIAHATKIYLTLFALFQKKSVNELRLLVGLLLKTKIPWIREILLLEESTRNSPQSVFLTYTVPVHGVKTAKTNSAATTSVEFQMA